MKTGDKGFNLGIFFSPEEYAILARVEEEYGVTKSRIIKWLVALIEDKDNPILKNTDYKFEQSLYVLRRGYRTAKKKDDPWALRSCEKGNN